jgi:hypothetical protein
MEASPPLIADPPKAVIEIANRLEVEFRAEKNSEGLSILSRLISDPRMTSVWQLLYSEARDPISREHTGEFFLRASFLPASRGKKLREKASILLRDDPDLNRINANLLEAEARAWEALPDFGDDAQWSEQDKAVQQLFEEACRGFLDTEPTFLADLQAKADQFKKVASNLRKQADILESLGWIDQAEMLADVASLCQEHAFGMEPILPTDEPDLIVRNRGNTELRTYIARLAHVTSELFGTPLYGVLATLANVTFENELMTDEKVRTLLRKPAGVK